MCNRFVPALFLLAAACTPDLVPNPDGRSPERAIEHIEPGMLVLTEVALDPWGDDTVHEWVEVANLTDSWLKLDGLLLMDADFNRSRIVAGELAPGAHGLLGRSADFEGPVPLGTWSGDMTLNNTGDRVGIYDGRNGRMIDQTAWLDGRGDSPGASWALRPEAYDHLANDDIGSWMFTLDCALPTPSPGAPHDTCLVDEHPWFGLSCDDTCTVPADFRPLDHLVEARQHADHLVRDLDLADVRLARLAYTSDDIELREWQDHASPANVVYVFVGDDGINTYEVFVNLAYGDVTFQEDNQAGFGLGLEDDELAWLAGRFDFPDAIADLSAEQPSFAVSHGWIERQGDTYELGLYDRFGPYTARWDIETGERVE